MNRREFIGGVAAGVVASQLPEVCRCGDVSPNVMDGMRGVPEEKTLTIPAGSLIYWVSGNNSCEAKAILPDGMQARVVADIVRVNSDQTITIRNTGKVLP